MPNPKATPLKIKINSTNHRSAFAIMCSFAAKVEQKILRAAPRCQPQIPFISARAQKRHGARLRRALFCTSAAQAAGAASLLEKPLILTQ
jgi:hypothetical protein